MSEIEFFNYYRLKPLPGFGGEVRTYEIWGHNSGAWGKITLHVDSDGESYQLRIPTGAGGSLFKERKTFAAILKAALRELPRS